MPTCDPKQLAAQIRKGELQNLYYIYGADLVQVRQLTAALVKKATGGNADMALTKFDGQKLELKELEDASRQFSMFAAYNCIQVHDLNADSLREDQMKQLLELLSEIGGATVLIFDITGFDPKDGKKTPQGKNKKLIDCVAKYGTVCEAVQRTPAVLAKELSGLAEKRGCILPPDSAEELVRLCMGNTLILRSELEKLCAYADKGNTITVAMVREVTSPQLAQRRFHCRKNPAPADPVATRRFRHGLPDHVSDHAPVRPGQPQQAHPRLHQAANRFRRLHGDEPRPQRCPEDHGRDHARPLHL